MLEIACLSAAIVIIVSGTLIAQQHLATIVMSHEDCFINCCDKHDNRLW